MTEKPKTTLSSIDHLLKEVYQGQVSDMLNNNLVFFGEHKRFAPYKPTFKEKWNEFWDHVPDFISYLKEYKYHTWRYWDKDGY